MLQEVKRCIATRYPKTNLRGDGQVVVVEFGKFRVEVLPAFYNSVDGSYTYGDTNDGGSWPICKPRDEIRVFNDRNQTSNRNLKRVCKMLRAWKDYQGAPMSGMLIDTLAYNFFKDNKDYDSKSYASYPLLMRDMFAYLANLPSQDYWLAPGSNQRVVSSGNFQRKAKKALSKCLEAIEAESDKKKSSFGEKCLGGDSFPSLPSRSPSERLQYSGQRNNSSRTCSRWISTLTLTLTAKFPGMVRTNHASDGWREGSFGFS